MGREYGKAIESIRVDPYRRLNQHQAEAIIGCMPAEVRDGDNYHGWWSTNFVDHLSQALPALVCAWNAIDKDADGVVSKAELDAWLLSPTVVFDHRIEYVRWDNTPATALSGLASDNVRRVVQSVAAKHFTSTGEDTMEYAVYMQHVLRPIT